MKKENLFIGGGVFAAVVSSLCCVLPLVAVVFGLGAFGAAAFFETLRPYLLALAFTAVAFGFYRVYFRREACADGDSCSTKPVNKMNQLFLWLATVAIVAFAFAPYYVGYLAAAATVAKVPAPVDVPVAVETETAAGTEKPANKTVVIGVRGMTCTSCETHIEEALKKLQGVVSVDADYKKKNVTVVYNPEQVTIKQIREAIAATGYELI